MIGCMTVQQDLKPWRKIEIEENGERMVPLEGPHLLLANPAPFVAVGAPYGDRSPWQLRESVLAALNRAGEALQEIRPGWKIYMHDAYRPLEVQAFMVEHTLEQLAAAEGKKVHELNAEDHGRIMSLVLKYWAVPSEDPATPPPHSTGGVIDCTFADREGKLVPMGGALDEVGPVSDPDHYIAVPTVEGRLYHANRTILNDLLRAQGFERHPHEWWHFSIGDQLWAWLRRSHGERLAVARFGRV